MDTAQTILLRAGGKDQLIADFSALCETTTLSGENKYSLRPTLENLAKFIAAQGNGPNKDMAVFELCHLVAIIASLKGFESLSEIFLMPQKASMSYFRHVLDGESNNVNSIDGGLALVYGDKSFAVRFGRMPFLGALYEFLCAMDGFSHYEEINNLLAQMVEEGCDEKAVRSCSNAMAAILRKYRIAYVASQQADGKFMQVYKFLKEEDDQPSHALILQDEHVFDFWSLHNKGKDYRGYRTVFDLFCDFARSFEESKQAQAARQGSRLGVNMEEGEIDISCEQVMDVSHEEWVSPFGVFDESEFDDIRFFKKTSERQPLEHLMAYGPDALRLPHAFLRYEIFGQVQAGITNDLQVGRGRASVERRVECQDVQSYGERVGQCRAILEHIQNLQASSLHVLGAQDGEETNLVDFTQSLRDKTAQSFQKMKRKGFDESAMDRQDLFKRAGEALVVMENQLLRYLDKVRPLESQFEGDQEKFSKQFWSLYQEVLE